MRWIKDFVRDDGGAVLSAEAVLLGTVGILGATVGLNLFAGSVNDELRDVAYAFRSLDQSYSVAGYCSSTAWTAGSCFRQEPVEVSLAAMRVREQQLRKQYADAVQNDADEDREEHRADRARTEDRDDDCEDRPARSDRERRNRRDDWGAD
jgi:hypothetical protein